MSITIDTPSVPESLQYDHIFMLGLQIKQEPTQNSLLPPVYNIVIRYRIYAIDSQGKRHFKKKNFSVSVNDYLAAAKAKEALSDTRMIDALKAIEIALSQLITEKGTIGSTTVTP